MYVMSDPLSRFHSYYAIIIKAVVTTATTAMEPEEETNRSQYNPLLSHITRKPVFGVSDQVRLEPACSATENS